MDELDAFVVGRDLLWRVSASPASKIDTYRLQVALHIANIPAPRAARVLARLVDHVLDETLPIEDPSVHDLKADDLCALLEDVH